MSVCLQKQFLYSLQNAIMPITIVDTGRRNRSPREKDNQETRNAVCRSAIAKYIDKKIDELKGVKTQREIAQEAGYETPNIISMIKRGESRVPLEKIPLLAKALGVDPAHMFRLAMEQYWPH